MGSDDGTCEQRLSMKISYSMIIQIFLCSLLILDQVKNVPQLVQSCIIIYWFIAKIPLLIKK